MPNGSNVPRWNLDSIYTTFDSEEYKNDFAHLKERITSFNDILKECVDEPGEYLVRCIQALEAAHTYAENLSAYAEAVYTTNTRDERALQEINTLETVCLPLKAATVNFRQLLLKYRHAAQGEQLHAYRFFIEESLEKAKHSMSPKEEALADDLLRTGGDAWTRLHESLTATLSVTWDLREQKTVTELRELAYSPDRTIREKAYHAELTAWESLEIPLAACLNGVKGWALSIDSRRKWKNAVKKSIFLSRINEKTLKALITTAEYALPLFQRYLKAKAKLLGIPKCTFYDLFAPVGNSRQWTWEEAQSFIVQQFSNFDPNMGIFAQKAFDSQWIDAEGHEGKVGGAYCTSFPLRGESRILCNFDGSFDSVTTVAHELGHAWHYECIKDLPHTDRQYPMTLAETASTFAETIVFEGALQHETEPLALIENNLKDCCQVLVDILCRFYFEKALFEERSSAECSPQRLCELMLESQQKTYGDALDSAYLHPYMWAVKSHYYSVALPFYNYPYAFGQLFSISLYTQAQEKDFAQRYRALLRITGSASCEDVAQKAGFNITTPIFWKQAVSVIRQRVQAFEKLARKK
ncbi:MAG: M3 family oligoendopeptidase [Treponema sp.]|nr:M3 family oligoendopeptidase [Treponema sp.]